MYSSIMEPDSSELAEVAELRKDNVEQVYQDYGVYNFRAKTGERVTGISRPDFESFMGDLDNLNVDTDIIVSPELITMTDINSQDLLQNKSVIDERLSSLVDKSVGNPDTTYVIGTPLFRGSDQKPENGVVIIRNGNTIGTVVKQSYSSEDEKEIFEQTAGHNGVNTIPGTKIGVLICSDLGVASMAHRPAFSEVVKRKGGEHLSSKAPPDFIGDDVETVLVPAAWSSEGAKDNEYYRNQLVSVSNRTLENYPNLREIVVIDRVWDQSNPNLKPQNAYFEK